MEELLVQGYTIKFVSTIEALRNEDKNHAIVSVDDYPENYST
jgi:hypothetical protein